MNNSNYSSILESPITISSIGLSFILMAFMYFFGIINIDSYFVLAVSLAGFFFVLADIFYLLQIKFEKDKTKILLPSLRLLCLFLSYFFLLVIPHISFPNKYNIESLSTMCSLITIGFTIVNISFNYMSIHSESLKQQIQKEKMLMDIALEAYELARVFAERYSEDTQLVQKSTKIVDDTSQFIENPAKKKEKVE